MKVKGVELILDNFRDVLDDYSVDVQDVVRSAILDGIDISSYLKSCRYDSYRLDQIRLSLKEGISPVFLKLKGKTLYQIRQMKKRGIDLASLENQLNSNLSDQAMSYLMNWVEDGINISKLNIAIIPNVLLETFDYGLRNGFSMVEFNTGKVYGSDYIKLCLQIMKYGKSVSFLLSEEWSMGCLAVLSQAAKMRGDSWQGLVSVIDPSISCSRLTLLVKLVSSRVNLKQLQQKEDDSYVYSDECLSILIECSNEGLNLKEIIKETTPEKMNAVRNELKLSQKRKVSGKLKRN